MNQVKADNMAIFIQREREDIVALWDALYYSDVQRTNFSLMDSRRFQYLLKTQVRMLILS